MPLFSNKKTEEQIEEQASLGANQEELNSQVSEEGSGFIPFNHTIIAPGVRMHGTLVTNEPLEIEGEFDGKLLSNTIVHVADNASLNADAKVNDIIVDGHVDGNLEVVNNTILGNYANYNGSLKTKRFIYSQNAYFNAKLLLPAEGRDEGEKPEDLAKELRDKFYSVVKADKERSMESLGKGQYETPLHNDASDIEY